MVEQNPVIWKISFLSDTIIRTHHYFLAVLTLGIQMSQEEIAEPPEAVPSTWAAKLSQLPHTEQDVGLTVSRLALLFKNSCTEASGGARL